MGEGIIQVRRTRLVVAGIGAIKCDLEEARRVLIGVDTTKAWIERSLVRLVVGKDVTMTMEGGTTVFLAQGSEILGPWERERED